jgi:CheY-like chemotaxis protein
MNTKNEGDSIHILLADDDIDDRSFFAKALRNIPIVTVLTSVQDGEQLVEYLSENLTQLPDIIFLDLSMPRKTGFECLIEIKEDEKFKEIPIVVFTTSFGRGIDYEQNLIKTLVSNGAQEFIRKPDNLEQLKQLIHKILVMLIENRSSNSK